MVKVFPLNGSKDMNFVICDVTEKDIKEIVNIERASFPTPWPPYFFTEELNLPISRFYCAKLNEYENNMVIGFILSHAILDELHLLNIACHPDYRRRGVATALFRHTLEENPQARIVFLEVREGNNPHALYTTNSASSPSAEEKNTTPMSEKTPSLWLGQQNNARRYLFHRS
jgi:ribosomal-protein-alanine N-acetyltransferase